MASPATSNSTLSLYQECPPGLGGQACQFASCNSTFVDPAARTLKSDSDPTCPTCDAGFSGLNCNICDSLDACTIRQQAVGRGSSGVAASGLVTINNTLTCNTQPKAVTQNNLQCDIDQPTLAALFPGRITLTAIKVADVPNFQSTGLSAWNAAANSSYSQVYIDGVEQFYCQSLGCSSTNTTTPVGSAAPFGTENWHCDSLQCFCIPGSRVCTTGAFPLADVINSLSGALDFPCNYVDPSDPFSTTSCAFSSPAFNTFVGPNGLSLVNCTFGQCLSQYDLEQDWLASSQVQQDARGSRLSGGVIAGLVVLGAAVAALLLTLGWGFLLLKRAKAAPREREGAAIGLAWENITYKVAASRTAKSALLFSRRRSPDKDRDSLAWETPTMEADAAMESSTASDPSSDVGHSSLILDGVSSIAAPGCLTVIIGASGAGKSSLVDILGGRTKSGQIGGQLSLLSESGEEHVGVSRSGRRLVAVVDQDDSVCLPGYMTVREVILFAAGLSNAENVPHSEQVKLVDSMLDTLGLTSIAHSRIGDARTRGISGGERRRVSLGIALVARPKILIVDEATSGLDAHSAQRIMAALRRLASKEIGGTTIIATLHQPSSDVFQMADACILLDRGAIAFQGKPSQAVDFCRSNGHPVPEGYNVADSLLSFAFQRRRKALTSTSDEKKPHDSPLQYAATPLAFNHNGGKPVTTFMTQLHALLGRYSIMLRRQLSGATTHILGSVCVALFVGGCFYQVGLDIAGFQNRVGSIFFIYILLLFASLSALTSVASTRLLMMRERSNGFYTPWSWVTAHLVYDLLLLRTIPSILITCIVYWMVGLRASPSLFFQFLLITVLFNWTVSIYQMLLAAIFEEVSTAILYAGLFIIFNIAFAGFILNLENIPAVLRWLKWICPAKYALEAVATQQLNQLQLVDNVGGVPISTSVSIFSFKLFGFQDNSYYRDLIVLACGFLAGFSLLLFGAVNWKMRERR